MEYRVLYASDKSVEIEIAAYVPEDGVKEWHVMIHLTETGLSLEQQTELTKQAIALLYREELNENTVLVWKRCFMSDPINQYHDEVRFKGKEALSLTGQAPLDYTRQIVWCYFVEGGILRREKDQTMLEHSVYHHYYYTGLENHSSLDEYEQTNAIFGGLKHILEDNKLTVLDNLIRTWIYVQGVDTRYAGMVKARKEFFLREGLTETTHYIASTGIEGRYIFPSTLVYMDAYAIKGLQEGQVRYLYAPENLSPTANYGVTFERGTVVEYGDRKHIFISGTASIDREGEIVYPLNIQAQTKRTLDNIQALLKEGGADFNKVAQFIIYLRDHADYPLVKQLLEVSLPDVPKAYVWAPVCRPGWLIEMECIAITKSEGCEFAAY